MNPDVTLGFGCSYDPDSRCYLWVCLFGVESQLPRALVSWRYLPVVPHCNGQGTKQRTETPPPVINHPHSRRLGGVEWSGGRRQPEQEARGMERSEKTCSPVMLWDGQNKHPSNSQQLTFIDVMPQNDA